jgi:SAM-dependent methyltransferase
MVDLVCPKDKAKLENLKCTVCGREYKYLEGYYDFILDRYLNPMGFLERHPFFYETFWLQTGWLITSFTLYNSVVRDIIMKTVYNNKGVYIDIACGTGKALGYFHEMGAREVIGLDISREYLKFASRKGKYLLLRASAEEIPLPSSSVNGATMFLAMHLMKDKKKVFDEVARILTEGSIFSMITLTKNSFSPVLAKLWKIDLLNDEDYIEIALGSGFKLIASKKLRVWTLFVFRKNG